MADKLPPAPTGVSGQTFVSNTTWTPTCSKDPMQSTGSRFSLSEYELAGFSPPITLSELTRWQTPSLTLARRTQWPTTPTLAMYQELPHSIRNWPESSTVSANKIPPPSHILPLPFLVLHIAFAIATQQNTALSRGAADLIWLAFFFLLRPSEYTIAGTNPHPFTLADVRLWQHTTPIDPLSAPAQVLQSATFVVLIFTNQKNAVRGETVGHGRSQVSTACPVLAVVRRILHLRSFNAPPHTPLCALNATGGSVTPAAITALLRQAGLAYSIQTNAVLPVIHQRALRPTGASALLAQGTDETTIKLLGRWKSDSALHYLHLQSHSRMAPFVPSLLQALC
jgi:hypothetical protein